MSTAPKYNFVVIGAGNGGTCTAAHLSLLGHHVRLFDVDMHQLEPILGDDSCVHLDGMAGDVGPSGKAQMDLVSQDLAQVLHEDDDYRIDMIVCIVPANAHRHVAKSLAPLLTRPGHLLFFHPGGTACALEVRHVLKQCECPLDVDRDVHIVEAMTLLYACRKSGNKVHVHGVKKQVTVGALPREAMDAFLPISKAIWPQFVPDPNGCWGTSLNNLNSIFHPAPTLFNIGRMEDPNDAFDYYMQGVSPSIAAFLTTMDAEKVAVAKALGFNIPSAVEWFHSGYGVQGDTIYEVVQGNREVYGGIKAPDLSSGPDAKQHLRYVTEDVPCGLVPLSELGKLAGVPTPSMDTIINLANLMFGRDFRAEGRHLEQLGLSGLTVEQIASIN